MFIKVNSLINQFIFSKNERNENYFDSSCRSVPVTQVQILVLDSRIRCVLSFSLEVSVVKKMKDCCTGRKKYLWIAVTCCVLIALVSILIYSVNGGLLSSRLDSEVDQDQNLNIKSSEIDLRQWMGQLPPHLTSRLGSKTVKYCEIPLHILIP